MILFKILKVVSKKFAIFYVITSKLTYRLIVLSLYFIKSEIYEIDCRLLIGCLMSRDHTDRNTDNAPHI